MTDETTVYINDGPINETEVYHAKKSHATRAPWREDVVDETTAAAASDEGLRPCKVCYPEADRDGCPSCGRAGETGADVLAPDEARCPNDDCRVTAFTQS